MEKMSLDRLSSVANTISELRQLPVYYSGDDTFVTNIENAEREDFLHVSVEISTGVLQDKIYKSTAGDNEFIWAQKENGYEGAYYIPCRKQIRIVKRLSGEMIPLRLTDEDTFGYEKKLIQLCPDDKADNFGMGYIVCLGQGHFIIYDGNGDLGGMAEKIRLSYGKYTKRTEAGNRCLDSHAHTLGPRRRYV